MELPEGSSQHSKALKRPCKSRVHVTKYISTTLIYSTSSNSLEKYRFHLGRGELLNTGLQGSGLLGFVRINDVNAGLVICLVQWEDYLQEDVRLKPVSLDIFLHVWILMRGKVAPISWLPDWPIPARETRELWDSCAWGLPELTREGAGYHPLPSAKYLRLCLSLSRCSKPLSRSPCYSRTSAESSAWVRLAKVCIYFGGPKERKMCCFRAGCWAFLEWAEHPQLQGLSTRVDNAQCQSWNEGYY